MTGVGYAMQGEGMLNWAFQQAGAPSVMVALWNIPVEESLKLYSTLYKALKEGKTKLQALQAASWHEIWIRNFPRRISTAPVLLITRAFNSPTRVQEDSCHVR